jgi:hypothetical protein
VLDPELLDDELLDDELLDDAELLDPEQCLVRYVPHVTSADVNFAPAFFNAAAAAARLPVSATSAATSAMVFITDLSALGAVFAAFRNDFDRLLIAPESTSPTLPFATALSRLLLSVFSD